MVFDPRVFDPDWMGAPDAPERPKPEPKPFRHRAMEPSRCPRCANRHGQRGRAYCLASGRRITEDSGTAECAFVAVPDAG